MFDIKNFIKRIYKKKINNGSVINLQMTGYKYFGKALISYLKDPILWDKNDWRFFSHSNNWESCQIINIFRNLGFDVDVINYDYNNFLNYDYDVIFDINSNLQLISPYLKRSTRKILHITGSYPIFQNQAEIKRIEDLENRKKCLYTPKRIDAYPEFFERSLKIADFCSLLGNDFVLNTFPHKYHHKINKITVTGSCLSRFKIREEYVPNKREFLWFFGGGAVHKGLDLILEVFARNSKLILNIIGRVNSEKDFLKIYYHELNNLPNIRNHGFMHVRDKRFFEIMKNVFCFIAPSCSEGISPAVVTCLQLGLYPIISRQTGITLPDGCGIYLETCSIQEIEEKVLFIKNEKKEILEEQIKIIQEYAFKKYSRENFTQEMKSFLIKSIFNIEDNFGESLKVSNAN